MMIVNRSKEQRYLNRFWSLDISLRILVWQFYSMFKNKVFTIDDLERFRREYGLSDTQFYQAVQLMRYLNWFEIRIDVQGHTERYWCRELLPDDFGLRF